MYFILSKSKDNNFSIKLFDSVVVPILLYGREIGGHENIDIIETIHNKFLKTHLPVKKETNYLC